MLVLRRRAGETIVVAGEVEIEIMEISRTRVKIGVRGPRHVAVCRKEAIEVASENRRASDLVASRGSEGMGQLLALLNNLTADSLKSVEA